MGLGRKKVRVRKVFGRPGKEQLMSWESASRRAEVLRQGKRRGLVDTLSGCALGKEGSPKPRAAPGRGVEGQLYMLDTDSGPE